MEWGRERVKLQLFVCISHVHAVESERMQVQPQRAITSLHEGYKSRVRFAYAR